MPNIYLAMHRYHGGKGVMNFEFTFAKMGV